MATGASEVQNQLCFQLYAASRAVTGAYRQGLADLGLTYPQYLVLLALWARDGQSVTDLCADLDLDTGTMSPVIGRMVGGGLVEKRRSVDDERSVTVHLTRAGRALQAPAAAVRKRVEAATGLSADQMRGLSSQLASLRESVQRGA